MIFLAVVGILFVLTAFSYFGDGHYQNDPRSAPRIVNSLLLALYGQRSEWPRSLYEGFFRDVAVVANRPELCEKINEFSYESDGGPIFGLLLRRLIFGGDDVTIFLKRSECYSEAADENARPELCKNAKPFNTILFDDSLNSFGSCYERAQRKGSMTPASVFVTHRDYFSGMNTNPRLKILQELGYQSKDPAIGKAVLKKFGYLLERDGRLEKSNISKRIDTVLASKKYYSEDKLVLDSDWEFLVYMKAINFDDISLCSKIREGIPYPGFIEEAPLKDECYYRIARNTGDENLCANISDRAKVRYGQYLNSVCIEDISYARSHPDSVIHSSYNFLIKSNEGTAHIFDILGYSSEIFDCLSADDIDWAYEEFIKEIPAGSLEGLELLKRIENMPSY